MPVYRNPTTFSRSCQNYLASRDVVSMKYLRYAPTLWEDSSHIHRRTDLLGRTCYVISTLRMDFANDRM